VLQYEVAATYTNIRDLFHLYDDDQSLHLEEEEVVSLLKKLFKSEGINRPKQSLQNEVHEMMARYDGDQSGTLEWHEFIMMISENPAHFKLKFDECMQAGLLGLVRKEYAMIHGIEKPSHELVLKAHDKIVQRLYGSLRSAYDACDEDVTSDLDEAEVARMLKKCFSVATAEVSVETMTEKVKQLMPEYDEGGKGSLEWDELLLMMCGCSDLGLPLEDLTCAGLLKLAWIEYGALEKSQAMTFGAGHELPVMTQRKVANLLKKLAVAQKRTAQCDASVLEAAFKHVRQTLGEEHAITEWCRQNPKRLFSS